MSYTVDGLAVKDDPREFLVTCNYPNRCLRMAAPMLSIFERLRTLLLVHRSLPFDVEDLRRFGTLESFKFIHANAIQDPCLTSVGQR